METILADIEKQIREQAPELAPDRKTRMNKILNSDNPNFECYGIKVSAIENTIKAIYKKYALTMRQF